LADDLGWYDTQIYNPDSPTPRILNLTNEGIRLDHHYVFRYCSPTRRSFLTGRFPNHVNTGQPDGSNLCSNFLPLNFSILTEKLVDAGYHNYYIGKGHLGYETMDHLPTHRGFKTHVGYLGGSEGYEHGSGSADPSTGKHDMWHGEAPGKDVVPLMYYSANYYAGAAIESIQSHAHMQRSSEEGSPESTAPLFMYVVTILCTILRERHHCSCML
jgi:arylsulfatase A-like enzyme